MNRKIKLVVEWIGLAAFVLTAWIGLYYVRTADILFGLAGIVLFTRDLVSFYKQNGAFKTKTRKSILISSLIFLISLCAVMLLAWFCARYTQAAIITTAIASLCMIIVCIDLICSIRKKAV